MTDQEIKAIRCNMKKPKHISPPNNNEPHFHFVPINQNKNFNPNNSNNYISINSINKHTQQKTNCKKFSPKIISSGTKKISYIVKKNSGDKSKKDIPLKTPTYTNYMANKNKKSFRITVNYAGKLNNFSPNNSGGTNSEINNNTNNYSNSNDNIKFNKNTINDIKKIINIKNKRSEDNNLRIHICSNYSFNGFENNNDLKNFDRKSQLGNFYFNSNNKSKEYNITMKFSPSHENDKDSIQLKGNSLIKSHSYESENSSKNFINNTKRVIKINISKENIHKKNNFHKLLFNNNKIKKNSNSKNVGNSICSYTFKKENILNTPIYKTINIGEIPSTQNIIHDIKEYKNKIKAEEKNNSYGKNNSMEKFTEVLENSCSNRQKNNVVNVNNIIKEINNIKLVNSNNKNNIKIKQKENFKNFIREISKKDVNENNNSNQNKNEHKNHKQTKTIYIKQNYNKNANNSNDTKLNISIDPKKFTKMKNNVNPNNINNNSHKKNKKNLSKNLNIFVSKILLNGKKTNKKEKIQKNLKKSYNLKIQNNEGIEINKKNNNFEMDTKKKIGAKKKLMEIRRGDRYTNNQLINKIKRSNRNKSIRQIEIEKYLDFKKSLSFQEKGYSMWYFGLEDDDYGDTSSDNIRRIFKDSLSRKKYREDYVL